MQPHSTLLPGRIVAELRVTHRITLTRGRSCGSTETVSNPPRPNVQSGKHLEMWSAGACSRFYAWRDVGAAMRNRDVKKSGGKPPHSKMRAVIFQGRCRSITPLSRSPQSGPAHDFSRCRRPASPGGRNRASGRLLSPSFRRESPNSPSG